jgi:hypothetical protein
MQKLWYSMHSFILEHAHRDVPLKLREDDDDDDDDEIANLSFTISLSHHLDDLLQNSWKAIGGEIADKGSHHQHFVATPLNCICGFDALCHSI